MEYHDIYFGLLDNIKEEEKKTFDGVRHTPITSVTSASYNLFQLENKTYSEGGYTIKCLNGEISFSGQSTSNYNLNFNLPEPLPAGTYSLNLFMTYPYTLASGIAFGFKTTH